MSFSSFECDVNFSRFSFHFVPKIVVVTVAFSLSAEKFLWIDFLTVTDFLDM